MKKLLLLLPLILCACGQRSARNTYADAPVLYIEEGEYEYAHRNETVSERRGAAPVVESNYIFTVLPKDTYFFDEKNMPMHGPANLQTVGAPDDADYKEPFLHKKAKRYNVMVLEAVTTPPPPEVAPAPPPPPPPPPQEGEDGYDYTNEDY